MKRIALLYIIIGIISIAQFGCGEAETISPDDEILYYSGTPIGAITYIRAIVNDSTSTTATNPKIRIDFSRDPSSNLLGNVSSESIVYDVTIQISISTDNGITYTPLTCITDYMPTPSPFGLADSPVLGTISINLDDTTDAHIAGTKIKINLSPDIMLGKESDPIPPIRLSPLYEFVVTVQ